KYVFRKRIAGRAVNEQERIEPIAPRQLAEELPAPLVVRPVVWTFELLAGPEDGALGADVEAVGVEHRALVMVAQERSLAVVHLQVDALGRVGTVNDDVAQAVDLGHPLRLDVVENNLQGLKVPMDIADQGAAHRGGISKRTGCSEGRDREPWESQVEI